MKTLAGVQFCYNAIKQDYCLIESLRSMGECCDHVIVVDAGSTDGTQELIERSFGNALTLIECENDHWPSIVGPEKLSVFTNIAIDYARRRGFEYILSVQSDEVIHEDSYQNIRAAVEEGAEAYVMARYNLFKDPYHMLNVEQARKPCSTEVIRLAKSEYRAYSDAEHLAVPSVKAFHGDIRSIEMFHMGYVRDRVKHLEKIRHVLVDVFRMGMDTRATNCEKFEWDRFFKEEDLIPIPKPLPKVVQKWARERYPEIKESDIPGQ